MTDLTQRPLIPIGVGPRTPPSSDAERFRVAAGPPLAANASTEAEPGQDDATAGGVMAAATAVTPGIGSLDAIDGLARDAAALREAVARFEIAGHPADTAQPDDTALLDTLAREQRARDDTLELTRGLARITTQSALLLVEFTDAAAAVAHRLSASPAATDGAKRRSPMRGLAVGAGVGLAGIAAVVSALALLQARDNARQMDRLQQALVQSISDGAQAQATAARTLEARLREVGAREAAIVAAIQAAAPVAPRAAAPEAARREPAKAAASSRNAKRKPAR